MSWARELFGKPRCQCLEQGGRPPASCSPEVDDSKPPWAAAGPWTCPHRVFPTGHGDPHELLCEAAAEHLRQVHQRHRVSGRRELGLQAEPPGSPDPRDLFQEQGVDGRVPAGVPSCPSWGRRADKVLILNLFPEEVLSTDVLSF